MSTIHHPPHPRPDHVVAALHVIPPALHGQPLATQHSPTLPMTHVERPAISSSAALLLSSNPRTAPPPCPRKTHARTPLLKTEQTPRPDNTLPISHASKESPFLRSSHTHHHPLHYPPICANVHCELHYCALHTPKPAPSPVCCQKRPGTAISCAVSVHPPIDRGHDRSMGWVVGLIDLPKPTRSMACCASMFGVVFRMSGVIADLGVLQHESSRLTSRCGCTYRRCRWKRVIVYLTRGS